MSISRIKGLKMLHSKTNTVPRESIWSYEILQDVEIVYLINNWVTMTMTMNLCVK